MCFDVCFGLVRLLRTFYLNIEFAASAEKESEIVSTQQDVMSSGVKSLIHLQHQRSVENREGSV